MKKKVVVKVGDLYVRNYPARYGGDFTLTPKVNRAATFYVEDVPAQVASELHAKLGLKARVLGLAEAKKTA